MLFRLGILFLAALPFSSAKLSRRNDLHRRFTDRQVHEKRHALPTAWDHDLAPADKRTTLSMRFNLKQSNLDRAEELLMAVSHPDSPDYGKHYTPDQVADLFSPSQDAVDTVIEWLEHAGIPIERISYSKSKGAIFATIAVEEAEELLDTEYHTFIHESGKAQLGCHKYSVPVAVKDHIDFITPTVHLDPHLSSRKSRWGKAKNIGWATSEGSAPVHRIMQGAPSRFFGLDDCDETITPACLKALYGLPATAQTSPRRNSLGIVEYTPNIYHAPDLDVFAQNYTKHAVGFYPTVVSIDGGNLLCNSHAGPVNATAPNIHNYSEANLDLEYAISLTYPVPITLYQVGDFVEGASFNNFLDAIDKSYCTYQGGDDPNQDGVFPDPDTSDGSYQGPEACGTFKSTHVLSISYAYNEVDLTPAYEVRQCTEYLKLGLQGVTVVYSSGDNGVAGPGNVCLDPSTGDLSPDGTRFVPSFPSTCPYVTSVGATQINPNSTVFQPESACSTFIFSGGGFSDRFPLPSYQKAAVSSYFKNHAPSYDGSVYNNSQASRGYPDLSANGANYIASVGGGFHLFYGTSASTPTVASIFTLLNDQRITVGKSTLGFINPFLYSHPWAFNDITSGGNQGCGTAGYSAVPGWDPVTGLGTPNYPKLFAALLSL